MYKWDRRSYQCDHVYTCIIINSACTKQIFHYMIQIPRNMKNEPQRWWIHHQEKKNKTEIYLKSFFFLWLSREEITPSIFWISKNYVYIPTSLIHLPQSNRSVDVVNYVSECTLADKQLCKTNTTGFGQHSMSNSCAKKNVQNVQYAIIIYKWNI